MKRRRLYTPYSSSDVEQCLLDLTTKKELAILQRHTLDAISLFIVVIVLLLFGLQFALLPLTSTVPVKYLYIQVVFHLCTTNFWLVCLSCFVLVAVVTFIGVELMMS